MLVEIVVAARSLPQNEVYSAVHRIGTVFEEKVPVYHNKGQVQALAEGCHEGFLGVQAINQII